MSQESPHQCLTGTVLEGGFIIGEFIGEGGMGMVYRGRQDTDGKDVCVKFIREGLLSALEWGTRFEREAQVLAKITHHNIVSIYAAGVLDAKVPYIVMEYVPGRSLRQLINTEGKLDWNTACLLMLQVCQAMDHAHREGIVHRDLKPDNVLVAGESSSEYVAKIIDFGLCGFEGKTTLTKTSAILGSVMYMAPECFEQSQHRASVDIYAIGCIFWECLTGRPIFEGTSLANISYKHATAPISHLDNAGLETTREITAIQHFIECCCAKDPADRFSSCADMIVQMKDILAGRVTLDPRGVPARRSRLLVPLLLSAVPLAVLMLGPSKETDSRYTSAAERKLARAEGHLDRLLSTYKAIPENRTDEKVATGKT